MGTGLSFSDIRISLAFREFYLAGGWGWSGGVRPRTKIEDIPPGVQASHNITVSIRAEQ